MRDQNNLQVTGSYKPFRDQNNLLISLQSNKVVIISPKTGQENFPVGGNYQWTKILDYDYYHVETSSSDTFSPLIEDKIVKATQLASTLSANAGYWIRIRAKQITTSTPVQNEVTGVSISPDTTTVTEGQSLVLRGDVQGTGSYNTSGTWTRDTGTIPFTVSGNDITFNPADGSAEAQSDFTFTSDGDNTKTATRTIIVSEASAVPTIQDDSIQGDLQALQDLYTQTDGTNWTNNTGWASLTTENMGDAHGVTVNAEGRVTELRLFDNNLTNYETDANNDPIFSTGNAVVADSVPIGSMTVPIDDGSGNPATETMSNGDVIYFGTSGHAYVVDSVNVEGTEITLTSPVQSYVNFAGDETPHVSNNDTIQGRYQLIAGRELSESFGNLQHLEYLDLGKNRLTGNIPSTLWLITSLKGFSLGFARVLDDALYPYPSKPDYVGNKFTGNGIPPHASALVNLERLYLDRNYFDNVSFPAVVWQLPKLKFMMLSSNGFVGSLPTEDPAFLQLSSFHLSGGLAHNPRNEDPRPGEPTMSGTLPESLGLIVNSREFRIQKNRFNGGFPLSYSNWNEMRTIQAKHSGLDGDFPNHLNNDNIPTLHTLLINRLRQMGGEIDSDFNMSNFSVFDIRGLQITGNVPNSLQDSTHVGFPNKIKILDLSEVMFDGPSRNFADDLSGMYQVRWIWAKGNNFTGSLPVGWPTSTDLKGVLMNDNQFSGAIPVGIGDMVSPVLAYISFDNNNLTSYESGAISPVVVDGGGNYVSGLRFIVAFVVSNNSLSQSDLDQIILDTWANVQSRQGTQWENWTTGKIELQGQSTGAVPSSTQQVTDAINGLNAAGWDVITT